MRRLLVVILAFLLSLQLAFAGGYQTFHEGTTLFGQGKYSDAKERFEACLNDPVFASVKGNIEDWINKCERRISEQRRDAQAAAARNRRELEERKSNNYVFLTVNTTENGVLYSTTESALSEVVRANGRRFHGDISKACSIVTVNIEVDRRYEDNLYYIATVSGTIRYGNAIDAGQYDGQASYTMIEGRSVISFDDAIDLALQKINRNLGDALGKLLTGQPVIEEEIVLDNSIVVYLNSSGIDNSSLAEFYNAICFYVDRNGEYRRNVTVDSNIVKALEAEYKRQGKMTTRKERSRIGEQPGPRYMLWIEVSNRGKDGYYFAANIFDMDKGYSVVSSPEQGYSYKNIYSLDRTNQELAASVIAVGLGLKKWSVGEKIGDFLVAKIDEETSHGLLMMNRITGPEPKMSISDLDDYLLRVVGPVNRKGWRYPYSDELEAMIPYRDRLGLRNSYWAEDSPNKGVYYVVSFQNREKPLSTARKSKKDYYSILVKEF